MNVKSDANRCTPTSPVFHECSQGDTPDCGDETCHLTLCPSDQSSNIILRCTVAPTRHLASQDDWRGSITTGIAASEPQTKHSAPKVVMGPKSRQATRASVFPRRGITGHVSVCFHEAVSRHVQVRFRYRKERRTERWTDGQVNQGRAQGAQGGGGRRQSRETCITYPNIETGTKVIKS